MDHEGTEMTAKVASPTFAAHEADEDLPGPIRPPATHEADSDLPGPIRAPTTSDPLSPPRSREQSGSMPTAAPAASFPPAQVSAPEPDLKPSFVDSTTESEHSSRLPRDVVMTVLSQAVEPCRFSLCERSALLETPVTRSSFTEVLRAHCEANGASPSELPESCIEPLADVLATAAGYDDGVTFADLLRYAKPAFPISTLAQRNALSELANGDRPTVGKDDVVAALDLPAADRGLDLAHASKGFNPDEDEEEQHPIVEMLFGAAPTVPATTLEQVSAALGTHPAKAWFPPHCTGDFVKAQASMGTCLPVTIMVVLLLCMIPLLDVQGGYTLQRTFWWPTTDDWDNTCPAGVTEPCTFLHRNLPDVNSLADAEKYFQKELVWQLWGQSSGGKAADQPWGGGWLVGGLLLRTSPMAARTNLSEPVMSCAALNLSVGITEWLMPQSYQCSAWDHVLIPFDMDQAAAQQLAQTFWINVREPNSDCVGVAQFGVYRPDDEVFAWTTVTISIPNGGGAVPRAYTMPVRYKTATPVTVLAAGQVFALIYAIISFVFTSRLQRVPARAMASRVAGVLFLPVLQTSLIVAAASILLGLPDIKNALQAEFIPDEFDRTVSRYQSALDLVCMWAIMLLGLRLPGLFKNIISVGLVNRLLDVALAETIGLSGVFGVIYLAFVGSGMALLGSTEAKYSSFAAAHAVLFPLFWGDDVKANTTEQNPVLGGVFYFVYTTFVVFVALNLLVAVITAPLGDVREAANLHLEVYAGMAQRVALLPTLERLKFRFFESTLPILNLLLDSTPFLPHALLWFRMHSVTSEVFAAVTPAAGPEAAVVARRRIEVCGELAVLLQDASRNTSPWTSLLVRGSEKHGAVNEGWEIVKLAVRASSPFETVRDARLLRVLVSYDQLTTDVDKLLELTQDSRDKSAAIEADVGSDDDGDAPKTTGKLQGKLSGATMAESGVFSPTEGNKDHEEPLLNTELFRSERRGDTVFAFTLYIVRSLGKRRWFFVYYVVILAAYFGFMVPLLGSKQNIAWLNENAHGGLRDFPYRQFCNDAQCTGGFTHKKTFNDQGSLGDFYQYLTVLLGPNAYPTTIPGNHTTGEAVPPGFRGVYWDKYLLRKPTIWFTQLRGEEVPCVFPSSATPTAAMARTKCFADGAKLSKAPLPRSPASGADVLPASAYEYQEGLCGGSDARSTRDIQGFLHYYPCAGYRVAIERREDLAAVAKWVDNTTRLIVVSVDFKLDQDFMEYTLYWELAQGGGTAFVWSYGNPSITQPLADANPVVLAVVVVNLLATVYRVARYALFTRKGDLVKAAQERPDVPLLELAIIALYLLLTILRGGKGMAFVCDSIATALLAAYITQQFLTVVVFPTAQLFTRRATTVLRVLSILPGELVIVLPFFAAAFGAFAIACHVAFGSQLVTFASLTRSLLTVADGFFGSWPFDDMFEVRPIAALATTTLFFLSVLTLLANLVLSLITGAYDAARAETHRTQYIENSTAMRGLPVYSGPLFECYLCWALDTESPVHKVLSAIGFVPPLSAAAHRMSMSASTSTAASSFTRSTFDDERRSAATATKCLLTETGRVGTPSELLCWLPCIDCRVLEEVARIVRFRLLPRTLSSSAVLLIAEASGRFEHDHAQLADEDRTRQKMLRRAALRT